MSTYRKVDPSTLGWVKNEIDETLKQARVALESFVENTSDRTPLRFCITHLHQVVGTLLMVELDGAAMMAREIETLAEAVHDEKVALSQPVLEALTGAILVLPDHLARLQFGHSDVPIKHLPLLNELRAARNAPPIAELDLFNPDLSTRPPAVGGSDRLADADYAALARQLRATFQGALLGWLRDSDNKVELHTIAGIIEELQQRAGLGVLEQLFWVAGGFIEGLIDGSIEATSERKKHLARLDQQIKKVVDGTEKSLLRSSSEALTRAMLYELAKTSSDGPKGAPLKQAFRLDALLGSLDETAQVEDHPLPSPEVLQSVARVLAKEIEQAQDLVATAFESHQTDLAALTPLLELLRKIGGTLEMLSVPILKNLIDEVANTCVALGEGQIPDPNAASMPMAQALLLIENSARDFPRSATEWKMQIDRTVQTLRALTTGALTPSLYGIEVSDATLTDSEYEQLLGVVAAEVGVNLGKIEEALEGFAAHTSQRERLDEIPKQLAQIQGALQILGVEQAVELAAATRQHVEDIRRGALLADTAMLDALAVGIGTIGAYVDGLCAGRTNIDSLIDAALGEMRAAVQRKPAAVVETAGMKADPIDALRPRLESWLANPTDARAASDIQEQMARIAARSVRDPAKAQRIATEIGRLIDLVVADPSALSEEVELTMRASCDALAAQLLPAPTLVQPSAPVPAAPSIPAPVERVRVREPAPIVAAQPPPDDFDEEIVQIFIEDARDVFGNIKREFANWRADSKNQAVLTELRRGYHTLKGSGRMVGASEIAELAWSVENMLNQIRDGKLPVSPDVFAIVEQSQVVLPGMIDQLEGGAAPAYDIAGLRARANDLVAGRAQPKAPAGAPASAGLALPKLDGTLLDIFTNEARGHIGNIRTEIATCRDGGSTCLVTPNLARSIHTLQGNARSLGIRLMAETCAEIEKLLHVFSAQHLPLIATHLNLLEQFVATVGDLVSAVANGATVGEGLTERFGEIARDARAEHDRVAPPELASTVPVERVEPVAPPAPAVEAKKSAPIPAKAAAPAITKPAERPMSAVPASVPHDSVDEELLEIFHEEAVDIFQAMEQALRGWRAEPANMHAVLELKRALHTLKGGARMAGALEMGNISHSTETLVMQIESRAVAASAGLFDLLEEAHDLLVSMLDCVSRRQPMPDSEPLIGRLAAAAAGQFVEPKPAAPEANVVAAPAPAAVRVPVEAKASVAPPIGLAPAPATPVEPTPPLADSIPPPSAANPTTDPLPLVRQAVSDRRDEADVEEPAGIEGERRKLASEPRDRRGHIRVNTDLLNNLVNYAGEVSISRSRMEQQIYGFRDNLAELRRNATRFREQLRELEIQSESQILYRLEGAEQPSVDFDPLEFDRFSKLQHLSRSLSESLHDLTTIQLNLGNFVGEAETVLQQQARINTELQEGLMRTRMVEFSTQAARLRHIVRQTARELGKRADLEFAGGDVHIDRTVLERMIGPFEHMIRNSLDHGIETEAERLRAGKPPIGQITITTTQEGSEIVIRFSDDGAGMNVEKIRAKAIERGLISADVNLNEEDVLQFVLLPGFSTASEITHVSGRGVGMDVVHSEVKQLGGAMAVDTKQGKGTIFLIRLPLTLSIAQALMVYVGDQMFAVPLSSVANIIECPVEQLTKMSVGKNPLLNFNDQLYSYMSLGARLGIPLAERNGRKVPVLLARAGTREVAMRVDGLGGTREIVIKTLGPQLSEIPGLGGATITGDGRVVLILDLPGLWYAEDALRIEHHRPQAPKVEVRERPVVMVVDDSLTVRKVTGKHLQKRGFDVMVAKDGVDAVEQLRGRVPDVMLVDIEMPRMDGYELTGRVRSEERLKHVPIIMITSRAGAKHRQRAFELGVDVYMSKPYQEDELFKNIDDLLAQGRKQ